MDFSFTPEQQRFRDDVRALLAEERVQSILRDLNKLEPRVEHHPHQIYRWLGERGWLAPDWPLEFGGLGKTAIEGAIVTVELALAGVPDTIHVNTVKNVGTFLLMAGTLEQKRHFLPSIARGDLVVTILYTEADSGSDLSSLTTRAERTSQGYRLIGRKIYNVKSQFADYALVAARTGRSSNPQAGISLFLVPLRGAGVRVEIHPSITDEQFTEVIFDGLEVGVDTIVGQVHDGWRLINAALALERTGIDYNAKIRHWLDLVIDHACVTGQINNPLIAQQVAQLQAQIDAGELMGWRSTEQQARGELDPVAAAMSKWYNSEIGRCVTRLVFDMTGLEGGLSRWDAEAPMSGLLESAYREAPGLTISAGTSEMMLYVIVAGRLHTVQQGEVDDGSATE